MYRKFEFYRPYAPPPPAPGLRRRGLAWLERNMGLHCCVLFRHSVEGGGGATGNVRCAVMDEGALLAWSGDDELELAAGPVSLAYARGDLCVGAFAGTRLVGYLWLAFGPAPHVAGLWVRFPRGAGYRYKFFVRPRHRGQGVLARLHVHADGVCRAKRVTDSFYIVDVHNAASLQAARRSGHLGAGYVGFLRAFGRPLVFRSVGARRAGFTFIPQPP